MLIKRFAPTPLARDDATLLIDKEGCLLPQAVTDHLRDILIFLPPAPAGS
ncbi:hypothetical protein [Micromonospora sp. NPDC048830]